MAVDGKAFWDSMGRFPAGVVSAPTRDKDGHRRGFAVSAFSSLSLSLP
jgi:flavin reductase (DIM6/NTAB) family NADH-FMN oxidoreductase RutF